MHALDSGFVFSSQAEFELDCRSRRLRSIRPPEEVSQAMQALALSDRYLLPRFKFTRELLSLHPPPRAPHFRHGCRRWHERLVRPSPLLHEASRASNSFRAVPPFAGFSYRIVFYFGVRFVEFWIFGTWCKVMFFLRLVLLCVLRGI